MSKLPRTLRAFNTYVDGEEYAGRCDSVTLPELSRVLEDHRAGGMNGTKKLEMGLESMTATLVISDITPRLYGLFGSRELPIILRGSVQAQGPGLAPEPVVVNLRGIISKVESGEWKVGAKTPVTVTFEADYFRYRQKDVEIVEIDIVNMIEKFDGVDLMKDHRKNIGL